MLRSGRLVFKTFDKGKMTIGRQLSEPYFIPTTDELEEIFTRYYYALQQARGTTAIVVKYIRGNYQGITRNGEYDTPFQTIEEAQSWANTNNKQVILLWHKDDTTIEFTRTQEVYNRILFFGGKWDSTKKCTSNQKMKITMNDYLSLEAIGFVNVWLDVWHDTPESNTYSWNNRVSIDTGYEDIVYSYIYEVGVGSRSLRWIPSTAKAKRSVFEIRRLEI